MSSGEVPDIIVVFGLQEVDLVLLLLLDLLDIILQEANLHNFWVVPLR